MFGTKIGTLPAKQDGYFTVMFTVTNLRSEKDQKILQLYHLKVNQFNYIGGSLYQIQYGLSNLMKHPRSGIEFQLSLFKENIQNL